MPQDLKLVVTLPEKSVRCTGGSGTRTTGTAVQTASVSSSCDSTWQDNLFECYGDLFEDVSNKFCMAENTCSDMSMSMSSGVCYANLDSITIESEAYLDETCYKILPPPEEGNDIELPQLQDDEYFVISGNTLTVSATVGLLSNDFADQSIEATSYSEQEPFYGKLLVVFDDGSFEYQAPDESVLGSNQTNIEDSFTYTACYIALPDMCSTAMASIVVTAD